MPTTHWVSARAREAWRSNSEEVGVHLEVVGILQETQALVHSVLGVCGFTFTVLSVSKAPCGFSLAEA